MSRSQRLAFAAAAFVAAASLTLPAFALPSGPVVVAKTSGKALLIWQATLYVNQLNARHETQDRALASVESAALQIIASRKSQLGKATTVSIRVLSTKTAATNDPRYAPTSFAGFQPLVVLTVTKAALAGSAKWPKDVDPKNLPSGVTAEGADKFSI